MKETRARNTSTKQEEPQQQQQKNAYMEYHSFLMDDTKSKKQTYDPSYAIIIYQYNIRRCL